MGFAVDVPGGGVGNFSISATNELHVLEAEAEAAVARAEREK